MKCERRIDDRERNVPAAIVAREQPIGALTESLGAVMSGITGGSAATFCGVIGLLGPQAPGAVEEDVVEPSGRNRRVSAVLTVSAILADKSGGVLGDLNEVLAGLQQFLGEGPVIPIGI